MIKQPIWAGALAFAIALLPAGASARENPRVTTDWLEKNLTNAKVRVLEVSVEPGQFSAATFRARRTSSGTPTWSTR